MPFCFPFRQTGSVKSAMKKIASKHSPAPPAATKQTRNTREGSLLEWCSSHQGLCFAVVSAVWVLALYWKALSAPFVYDDLDQIVNNPSLRSWHATFSRFFLSPVSFTTGFLGTGGSTYRPIYWLTLALDRQIWGIASSSGFHFTNLLLHWANGVLLFQLLRRTKISLLTAATVSVVWLGLPINTEAVAWVSGRAYLLSTFFILLSLLAACSYLTEDLNKRKIGLLIAYFALSMGALFSHEQGL